MESSKKEVVRIVLEGDGKMAHDKMTEILKSENQFIRISPSKLGSWMFKRFYESYFEKDKVLIAKDHFDSKEHLKEALKSAQSPEELERALKEALSYVQAEVHNPTMVPQKKRGRPSKKDEVTLPKIEENSLE